MVIYKTKRFQCECGKSIAVTSKTRHIKSKYHTKHIQILNGLVIGDVVLTCECGDTYTKSNRSHHIKSKRHTKNLIKLEPDYKHLENELKRVQSFDLPEKFKKCKIKLIEDIGKLMKLILIKKVKDQEFYDINDKIIYLQINQF